MLLETMKFRRFERGELLITSLKHRGASWFHFFSDVFNAKIKHKNDRWLCKDENYVPVIGTTKFPGGVYVLKVISSEGDVMPPHNFCKNRNVTKEVYLDVIKTMVKPWIGSCRETLALPTGQSSCWYVQFDSDLARRELLYLGILERESPKTTLTTL